MNSTLSNILYEEFHRSSVGTILGHHDPESLVRKLDEIAGRRV